jgi:DNA repair protein RecN (Recombination protein N)
MADNHLYIAKTSAGESTVTQVRPLSERERISEIARMASGVDVTTASLDNAKEMVSHAKLIKKKFSASKKY